MRFVAALALLALTSVPAHAQLGGAFGFRSLTADESSAANSDRRGYEGRLYYGQDRWGAFGWRAELIGTQMQFQRDDGTRRFQVSENDLELAALLKARVRDGALTGVYAIGGPVQSWRVVCGSSGQNSTACDDGPEAGTGYVLGVGYQSPITQRRDLTFEVRYYDGVVAGAGSPILSFSLGLEVARR